MTALSRTLTVALILTALPVITPVYAEENPPQAQTVDDPAIPLDELKLLVRPLTKDELEVEADAWFSLVKQKVAQITQLEVEIKRRNRQIRAAQTAASATEPASDDPAATQPAAANLAATQAAAAEAHAEVKEDLLETVNRLREERISLTDRLNIVLAELELKGGDITEYERYVNAIAGITVDVADAAATWTALVGWLTSAEGGIRWGLNIVWFFLTLFVFWILSLLAARAMRQALRMTRNLSDLLRDFAINLVRRIVLLTGLLVAVSMLEVKLGPVLAIIGGAAFVIAFALQGTLSNFASGLLILAYRPFDVGDVVNAGGVFGTVEAMNLVSTHIKTFDNQRMVVPNNEIWGNVITNVTGLPTRRIDMTFGISYADDVDKAARVLEEIIRQHPLTLDDPAPMVKVGELGDSSVNFLVRPWCKTPDYWTIYWDVTREVKQRFDFEGISIPFPQRDVHLHQAGSPK